MSSTGIDVIMPAFNVAGCIERAVRSLQGQRFTDWRLFIVDDASGDDTFAVASALAQADGRIDVRRLPANAGPGAARNAAIAAGTAPWIAVMDADDALAPERLATMLGFATERRQDFVADNQLLVDWGQSEEDAPRRAFALRANSADLTLATLLRHDHPWLPFSLGLMKPLVRRAFLAEHGLRYSETYRVSEDFLFYAAILAHGARASLLDRPMYIYTQQVGARTGARSPLSRTDFRWSIIAAAWEEFEADYASRLSPEERRAGQARRRALMDASAFETWKQRLRDRDPRVLSIGSRVMRAGYATAKRRLRKEQLQPTHIRV